MKSKSKNLKREIHKSQDRINVSTVSDSICSHTNYQQSLSLTMSIVVIRNKILKRTQNMHPLLWCKLNVNMSPL